MESHYFRETAFCCLLGIIILFSSDVFALDTDIYKADGKNNAYMLMDSSDSMRYGVYESSIDYGAMFDYFFTLNDKSVGDYDDYIYDTVNNSNAFYKNHVERHKIFLWKGEIGVTIAQVDGKDIAFTGDAADPDYLWYMSSLVDTHTVIDEAGNLFDDGSGKRRITVGSDGYILLDGERLPLGMDVKLHDLQTLYDGSVVDRGFGGLINAPGYYFSGYEGVDEGELNKAEDGDDKIYFFVAGNWVNMQSMYNLHYTQNMALPDGAEKGDMAWVYEKFPVVNSSWPQINYSLKYPDSNNGDPVGVGANGEITYIEKLTETVTARVISHPGARKIQLHFSLFDVIDDGDFVAVYDGTGALLKKYDNSSIPADGWSVEVTGDKVLIKLQTNNSGNGQGYEIDKLRVVYYEDGVYLMQSRLDVAKDAMSYVALEFADKINWGFATFGSYADGADIKSTVNFNPDDNDDNNGNELVNHISQVTAYGGTPLGEALQDLYIDGYYKHSNSVDNHSCRKSYIIAMTDGFPSADTEWQRIRDGGRYVGFQDWDNDGWTNDPYQYSNPAPDYYDDVAHWLYTHSWKKVDQFGEVDDPETSYDNIITHHISFGAYHPFLADAAGESGGEYIATYNKEQLVSAFHSLSLMIAESVSFTAPVVSVDAANKIQSGDDLYMGLFMPKNGEPWVGNLKKFKLGDGSKERPEIWMIYDGENNEAIDSTGQFLDNTAAFWGDDSDANDSDSNVVADIQEDGVGEVLTERVAESFASGDFWERKIYTYKNGQIVSFDRNKLSAADLSLSSDSERDKLINFIYGYSYGADAAGNPIAVRKWALGAIVHSRPVVVDYYDTSDPKMPLDKRYIVIGANDGMLHVFDEVDGKEVFAFIPSDLLPQLKKLPLNDFFPTVDGIITLYRRDGAPKYLIFGERRGGKTYWCLDVSDKNPLNWKVKWQYTNPEIQQSWSEVQVASILIAVDETNGSRSYKDVAIFTGGYDSEEDFYPEPFVDQDNNGTPYDENGNLLSSGSRKEWDPADADYDYYDNDSYDIFNPEMNEYGRGAFIVDIDNPSNIIRDAVDTTKIILPFSVTYSSTDVISGSSQSLSSMKYCFPGGPSVIKTTDMYEYYQGGSYKRGYHANVMKQMYLSDIYGNIFKITYDVTVEKGNKYTISGQGWKVNHIFSANPGSYSESGYMSQGDNSDDIGRKSFFSPAVSWGGSGAFFDKGNYYYPDTVFDGTDKIASLFFGTGDREHPRYTIVRNRMYAVYDDSSVTAIKNNTTAVAVTSAPYTEDDLLNLSGDELGDDVTITSCYLGELNGACDNSKDITEQMQKYLKTLLTDDPVSYDINTDSYVLEDGSEDDAKGWYIVLEDQGDCYHCSYPTPLETANDASRDNHIGEKILSRPVLYYNNVYFTSYQPSYDDPCNPQGNGFVYALDYLSGKAALNLNKKNGTTVDITDRYRKYTGIYGIPSGFTIIHRNGQAAAMAAMGGSLIGPGEEEGGPGFQIPSPGLGLELYYWREGKQ